MSDLVPIKVELGGTRYELLRAASGEPLVYDLEFGRWLEYSKPYKIRELIERHLQSLGEVSPTVGKTSNRGGRPGREYHLTESQALFIAAKSDTPRATELLRTMIAVFMMARRGQLGHDDLLQPSVERRSAGLGMVRTLDPKPTTEAILECFGHGCIGAMHGKTCPHFRGIVEHAVPVAPAVPVPDQPLHSIRTGTLEIGGYALSCAILSDGRAVVSAHDFYAAFGRRHHKGHGLKDADRLARLPAVLLRPGVQGFVGRRLPKLLAPIRYRGRSVEDDAPQLVGVDPEAVTEVCAAILRAVTSLKLHPSSTKAVQASVKVLAAIAQRPWAARIEEACGGTTALARPAPTAVGSAAPERDPYEAIADAVVQRLRARRTAIPVTRQLAAPDLHEMRMRLANIENSLLQLQAREDML